MQTRRGGWVGGRGRRVGWGRIIRLWVGILWWSIIPETMKKRAVELAINKHHLHFRIGETTSKTRSIFISFSSRAIRAQRRWRTLLPPRLLSQQSYLIRNEERRNYQIAKCFDHLIGFSATCERRITPLSLTCHRTRRGASLLRYFPTASIYIHHSSKSSKHDRKWTENNKRERPKTNETLRKKWRDIMAKVRRTHTYIFPAPLNTTKPRIPAGTVHRNSKDLCPRG